MELGNAINAASDYNNAIEFIKVSKNVNNNKDTIVFDDDSELDDQIKSEYIIALLGRARANRNLALTSSTTDNKKYAIQSSNDYEQAIILSSRYNDCNDMIVSIIDGSQRHPYKKK